MIDDIFNENNFYWCPFCGYYAMELICEDERDYVTHRTYECFLCGEHDFETVDNI